MGTADNSVSLRGAAWGFNSAIFPQRPTHPAVSFLSFFLSVSSVSLQELLSRVNQMLGALFERYLDVAFELTGTGKFD